jgi:hypothetical protein
MSAGGFGKSLSERQSHTLTGGRHQQAAAALTSTYADDINISFVAAILSTTRRIHDEFLRLLFLHAHQDSEEFLRPMGQLAQPNQDLAFSKRAAFFAGIKSKAGHIMSQLLASWLRRALRINVNLAPLVPSAPRPSARKSPVLDTTF